jgi:hypothetical protein
MMPLTPRRSDESDRANSGIVKFIKFQGLFKRSLGIDPRRWKEAVDRVWKYYPHDAVVLGIIPEDDVKLRHLVLQWVGKK